MSDPSQKASNVASALLGLLEEIPPNDRLGFLFGMVIALLQSQGFSEDQVRSELNQGMDVAYGRKKVTSEQVS